MKTNLLNIIDDELIEDGFDTEITDAQISWKDTFGAENIIYEFEIAYNEKDLAWWQHSEVGKDLLRIKKPNDLILNWRPKANHHSFGFNCRSILWLNDCLIVIYKNKHTDYIFRFKNLEVKQLHAGSIAYYSIKNENIYIQEPSYRKGRIFKIAIFKENETVEISQKELDADNIIFE